MGLFDEYARSETRRHFFSRGSNAVGWAALTSLLGSESTGLGASLLRAAEADSSSRAAGKVPAGMPHFAPKAKNVIYLHMVGGPSQMDLYDYKPKMGDFYDKDLPDS